MDNYDSFDINDLLNDPMLPEPVLFPQNDLVFINQRLEQLTIDVNTQNIKLELETLKRRRLRRSLNQVKNDITSLSQLLAYQSQEQAVLRSQIEILSESINRELACLTQRTHCCIGRIHHLLIATVPRIFMTQAEHNDIAQQAAELLRALQLIRVTPFQGY